MTNTPQDALITEQPRMTWIPITDALPDNIDEYVIWLHIGRVNMQLARLSYFFKVNPPEDFTHWMRLPADLPNNDLAEE